MSVRSLHRALQALLMSFGVPVYAEGQVPDGAAYPYITWSCQAAGFGDVGRANVTCWTCGDYDGCIGLLDRLNALIPEQGMLVAVGAGKVLLWSEETTIRTEAAFPNVVGGQMRLRLRCYLGDEPEEVEL